MLAADPLSDVLSLLSARSLLSASLRARGDWSIRFASDGVKFNAVLEGGCYLVSEGGQARRLEAGDCFLLVNCGAHVLCSDPSLPPVSPSEVFGPDHTACIRPDLPGEGLFAVGGRVTFDDADAGLLLDALPPILFVSGRSRQAAAIRWLLARLGEEWDEKRPGGSVAADHLAQLLFVELIRVWLDQAEAATPGWLQALADRRIGAAIRLLHGDPARNWRLQDLAEAAGMSRSNFALRFRKLAGMSPLDYLLRWRMRLGAKALRSGAQPISAISYSLGYRSESAFSNAFKRINGIAPQQYRRDRQNG
ncbi:AraC family transcriptional regulator [Rhizobium sp. KDH_Rht_773_N]